MKFKKLIFRTVIFNLLLIHFLPVNVKAGDADTGAVFRPLTLQQAIAAAKSEKKKGVFVHCFAEWCHYCQYMRDSVYTDKEVGEKLNPNFISIKIDLEKEGKELNETLKIHTYPGLVFYDTNGEIMHRAAGRKYKQPFLDLIKDALDTTKQMRTFKRKYDNGTATPYEVMSYFRMLEMAGMDAQSYINDYLMKQSDSDFTSINCWRIIYDIIKDPTMAAVNRVLDMRNELAKKYTMDSVENKMVILHNFYLSQFVQQLDSVGYEKGKRMIMANKRLSGGLAEKICAWADLNRAKLRFDYDSYRTQAPDFIKKYAQNDSRRINDICGVLYERFSGDSALMLQLQKWLEHSTKLNDYYKGYHVLASVYTVQGKLDLAIKTAEHAIELGKVQPYVDYKQTTVLLNRLNEMKEEKGRAK